MAMTAATLSSVMWKIDRLLGMLGSWGHSSLELVSVPFEEALNSLRSILPKLQSAANVVEEEELPEAVHDAVGEWMDKVKAVAYDAEDVLDDCEHELLLQLQLDAAAHPAAVGDSVASATAGDLPVLLRISDIRRKFEGIMTEHAQTLNLRLEGIAMMSSPTILSPVPPPSDPIQPTVYGREDDMEKIVQLLLSSSPDSPQQQHGDQHPPIVAVVGEEGIGKTTLCRLVYTDPRICEHFDFRIWASVSQQCLAMDAIAGYSYYREEGYLPYLLQWELTNKHFLLVVDGLEPEDLGFWESVYNHLSVGSRGSQVLLTSRTEEHLAKVMAAAVPSYYRLGYLTGESSWSLFKDFAFHGRDHEVPPSIEAIGREICRKCEGSPLLLKMMGALLHSGAASKEKVLQSRCWKSKHRAIQAVPGFCFRRLPSHIRRCLVYCSLFPKGYPFTRDQLVRLWMAQDFLPPEEGKQMEDVGDDIIERLLWCSFLAHPPIGEQTLVMSGPIHDLARSHMAVLTESSRKDDVEEISMDARHASLLPCNACNGEIHLPSYSKPVHLKSCFLVKSWGHAGDGFYFPAEDVLRLQIPGDFFLPLGHLSSLDLSYSNVEELPESVGMLTHLRYLSLNRTYIKELPESMSTLHSLWTLELRSCMRLRALPRAFKKLTSLRHLDTQALRFPLFDIGELTNLRTVTCFILRRGRRSSTSTISQLKHLGGLRGELHIIGLNQVLFAEEAEEAKLGNKEHIEKLTLEWPAGSFTCDHDHDHEPKEVEEEEEFWELFDLFDDNAAPTSEVPVAQKKETSALVRRERPLPRANRWFREEVFESLRPHPNLKHLAVESYSGARLPSWMGDPSFSRLVSLTLIWCNKCRALPPGLGRLPSLRQLTIKYFGMWRKQDGSETEPIILKGFSSLEELRVENMPWWEEWCGPEEDDSSPLRLRSLYIDACPRLKRLPQCLPSLKELEIAGCHQLIGLPTAPSLVRLVFYGLTNAHSDVKLGISSWLGGLTTLKSLSISGIGDLTDPPLPKLPTLRRLAIYSCEPNRRPPSLLGLHDFVGLQNLKISFCRGLCFLPEERLPSTLKVLSIEGCPLLRDWCLQQRSTLAPVPWITLDGASYDQVVQDAEATDQPQAHVP